MAGCSGGEVIADKSSANVDFRVEVLHAYFAMLLGLSKARQFSFSFVQSEYSSEEFHFFSAA